MNAQNRFEDIYNNIKDESELHWFRTEPAEFLVREIKKDITSTSGKKALDIGCGTGFNSIFLAQQGFDVTGLDFVPKAVEIAQKKATKQNINAHFMQADVLKWKTSDKFDLVLDSGCLHTMNEENRNQYKKQLLTWLKPNAKYVLFHFAKENFPYAPTQGPKPKSREEILSFLEPELKLIEFNQVNGQRTMNQYAFTAQLT